MRIVIPEGAEFVQKPEHLDPLRRLGELVVSPGHPRDKADFIERVKDADVVVLQPSNPVVSIGTIVGVAGIREALASTNAPVVGLSPIVAGHHVRGMAEQLLTALGLEVSASGVALHYGSRGAGGLLDGWLVDTSDAEEVGRVEAAGIACRAVPLLMTDVPAAAAMAAEALALVGR